MLIAIGVGSDGYRHILGVAEGEKEDLEGWRGFLRHLKSRGLTGVQLLISDACVGLVEAAAECYPQARWQRCVVHWYRNVFAHVPRGQLDVVKHVLGFRRFSLRGLEKVCGEWDLVCLALNAKRLHALMAA